MEALFELGRQALRGSVTADVDQALKKIKPFALEELSVPQFRHLAEELSASTLEVQALATGFLEPMAALWRAPDFESYNHLGRRSRGVAAAPESWRQEILAGQDAPKLRLVRELSYNDQKLVGKTAMGLFECHHLVNVELLDVGWNKLPATFFKRLATSPQGARVRVLLSENNKIQKGAAKAMGATDALPCLRHLKLNRCNFDKGAFELLLQDAGGLGRLEWLDIGDARLSEGDIRALIGAEHLAGMRVLELEWVDLRGQGTVFFAAPQWAELRTLNLSVMRSLTEAEVVGLAAAEHIDKLEVLKINYCSLPDSAIVEIIRQRRFATLRTLNINDNKLTDTTLDALVSATHLDALESLDLNCEGFTAEGLVRLFRDAPHLANLRHCRLPYSAKGNSALLRAVKGSPYLGAEVRAWLHEQLSG